MNKVWNNPEIMELNIAMTLNGKLNSYNEGQLGKCSIHTQYGEPTKAYDAFLNHDDHSYINGNGNISYATSVVTCSDGGKS